MKQYKLLDLYCKAGGCSKGYSDAGFDVYGVDIVHQKNYVHPGKFLMYDAIEFIYEYGHLFDVIAASPPCQKFSITTAQYRKLGKEYPDLIEPTREAIKAIGKPGIMENVPQAPISPDIVLRGDLFGLKVLRRRHFELINWTAPTPELPKVTGSVVAGDYVTVFGSAKWISSCMRTRKRYNDLGKQLVKPSWSKETVRETWAYAMGIDWYMTDREIAEAIPPAYTRYIGQELIKYLNNQCIIQDQSKTVV